MKNLINAITAENEKSKQRFIDGLKEIQTVEAILNSWHYKDLMTAGKKKQKWTIEDLKNYLIERNAKKKDQQLQEEINRINQIASSEYLNEFTISIEWKRSRTWGNNPTAEASINRNSYTSGSIGGCGYDKESTAVAKVINQSEEFLKMMYLVKDANIETSNRDLFGYGSGSGILPRLEGGVGVSCYNRIFNKIGYEFKGIAHGKTYDCYQVNKVEVKELETV
jgi:hypothetical protein